MFKETLEQFTDEISFNEPMKKHTAYGVGGNAKYFSAVRSLYTLNTLVQSAKKHRVPFKVLGNFTNVLVSDKGFDGLIITTKCLKDVFFNVDEVKAMSGATISDLIRFCIKHRLTGLEQLAGIPATVGGAVVMNAGAFGHNISDRITTVETLSNGKIKRYDKLDCKFAYRKSRFSSGRDIVTSVSFKFDVGERELVQASVKSFGEIRRGIQPVGKTCGSVFKNPQGVYAGRLIEDAGLKGFAIGGASVSQKHANFILNEKNATALDIFNLINHVKNQVYEKFNVLLKEEVEFIGDF